MTCSIVRPSRARSVALCCALLAVAGATGCRTAAPARGSSSVAATAPPAAGPRDAPRDATPPQPVAVSVQGRARVVVTPDAGVYVVVVVGPMKLGARLGWSLAYLAGPDPGAAAGRDAVERLQVSADALFRTQQPLAEASGAELVAIVALFGAPGEPGVAKEIGYERGPEGWRRSDTTMAGEVAPMPPVPASFERSRADEASAVDVALRFLAHLDRLELDDAWDLSSVVVKATMSRTSFEQQLRAGRAPVDAAERQEVFRSFDPGPFIPGADLEVLFARPHALEGIQLRMDDDMEWRVAGVTSLTRGDPPPPTATAAVEAR